MYKIFFPILLSGIGIYYYYHFKYLNNEKEKIFKNEIKKSEENEINRIEEKNVEEEIKLDDMLRYQIILYKDPITIFNNWELIN